MIRLLSVTAAACAALVLASPAGAVTFQTPVPSAATTISGSPPWINLAPADLDQDGLGDYVVGAELGNKAGRLISNGDATFTLYEITLGGTAPGAASVGRLNGDAYPDAVFPNQSPFKVQVGINNGAGAFAPFNDLALTPNSVDLGDLN